MNDEIEHIIVSCLDEHYGLKASVDRLRGENLNYLVCTDSGEKYVLKVVDDHMPSSVVEMEAAVIEHAISGGFSARLPKIRKNMSRKYETRINIPKSGFNRARLIDFVPGTELIDIADISHKLFENTGKCMAEFNNVMADFDHPAAHRTHRWDLANASQHKKYNSLITDRNKRVLLEWAFKNYEQSAASYFAQLPSQYIHGDGNKENLMTDTKRIIGLVDFGDGCFNPTICELAICLAYLMQDQPKPFEIANLVTRGYESVRPLSQIEEDVLFPLVCGRLACTVSMANQRKHVDPDNPNWFGGEASAWQLLAQIHDR